MPSLLFEPHVSTVPIAESQSLFPVRRIYCIARNYEKHVKEMGHELNRDAPFFFNKHPDSVLINNAPFPYPTGSNDVHHEVEMVVALKSGGKNIETHDALDHVFGYAVGLDMTRRDLQTYAKQHQQAWATAKAFDHATPISTIIPSDQIGHPNQGEITLLINGEIRQNGNLAEMIWSVPEIIAYLSNLFELKPGDLIFTGTPAGVGPVNNNDQIYCKIENIGELRTTVHRNT